MQVVRYCKYILVYLLTSFLLTLLHLIERFLPKLYTWMLSKMHRGTSGVIDLEDFLNSFKDCQGFKTIVEGIRTQVLYGEAKVRNLIDLTKTINVFRT